VGGFALILLDTHVLVWAVAEPTRLSPAALEAIERFRKKDGLAIAAISLWELGMLFARGRIQAYGTIDASIRLVIEGITVKPITPEIVAVSTQFPPEYPSDPADRLIGATARIEGLALVTRDEKLRQSPLLQTIW
jgi:PIN domain nuclease of toxin-antitoxin system